MTTILVPALLRTELTDSVEVFNSCLSATRTPVRKTACVAPVFILKQVELVHLLIGAVKDARRDSKVFKRKMAELNSRIGCLNLNVRCLTAYYQKERGCKRR